MSILRWFLVIPAAILAAVIISFPIHWFVMINLGGCSEAPIIEIRDRDTLKSIEIFLQGLLGPFAFVYADARTAPSRHFMTAIILVIIVVVGGMLLASWINSRGTRVEAHYGIVQMVSQIVGSVGAALLIKGRDGWHGRE